MTEADSFQAPFVAAVQELVATVDMLQQAEQERDQALAQVVQAQRHADALSKRLRSVLRSRKHIAELRGNLDALHDLLDETTNHTGETR